MKYTDSHEWILVEGNVGTVGISAYARDELGEVVYVELPKVGERVSAGDEVVILESTKAAADLYTPVSGVITAVNESVKKDPSLLSKSPEDLAWLVKISLEDPTEMESLLDKGEYLELIGTRS